MIRKIMMVKDFNGMDKTDDKALGCIGRCLNVSVLNAIDEPFYLICANPALPSNLPSLPKTQFLKKNYGNQPL